MAGLVEFYLTGIWGYRDAGVKRIITSLRSCEIPGTDYTFDPETNWFKVICREDDVNRIRAMFARVQSDIENDVDIETIKDSEGRLREDIVDNKWIKAVQDQILATGPSEAPSGYQCPAAFDKYPFRRVWSRIEEEAEPGMTLGGQLREGELGEISQSLGAFVSHDLGQRIVYIGAGSQSAVDHVARKLDTLFEYSRSKPPYASHLLYGEAASSYTVDARYMAHINPNLVTSTIFDPGQLRDTDLETQYRALFSSVSLRFCLHDPFKGAPMSLFGPRAGPCFTTQARRWSPLFHRWNYAPKAKENMNTPTPSGQGSHQPEELSKMDQVAHWVAGIRDANLATDGSKESQQQLVTVMAPTTPAVDTDGYSRPPETRESACSNTVTRGLVPDRALMQSSILDGPAVSLSREAREKTRCESRHEYASTEEKVDLLGGPPSSYLQPSPRPRGNSTGYSPCLRELPVSADKGSSVPSQVEHKNAQNTAGLSVVKTSNCPVDNASRLTSPLPLTTSNSPRGRGHGGDCLYIEPANSGATSCIDLDMKPLTPILLPSKKKTTGKNHIVQEPQIKEDLGAKFLASLHANLVKVVGAMRAKVGTVYLRAEFGRICLMDPVPGGLAFNTREEVANGWNPATLLSKLEASCNSTKSVAFTRIVSTTGNDADYLVNQTNDAGDRMWSLTDKRVWYDFTCRRTIVDAAGRRKGSDEFVVEIEGSRAGEFSYRIHQHEEEEKHLLWVHCLQRHWDVRFVVAHVPQACHEARYGAFAKALLSSLVIHPRTKQIPRIGFDCDATIQEGGGIRWHDDIIALRIRHVARHVGRGGETYLDLTYVQDMRLVFPTGRQGQAAAPAQAMPAEDNATQGKSASWYEASVTSARGEELFAENETMSLGDEAAWTPAAMDREGVFPAVYEPALAMVRKMDGVGVMMDNGQDSRMEHPPRSVAVVEAKRATKSDGYMFW